jgi:hemoglobin
VDSGEAAAVGMRGAGRLVAVPDPGPTPQPVGNTWYDPDLATGEPIPSDGRIRGLALVWRDVGDPRAPLSRLYAAGEISRVAAKAIRMDWRTHNDLAKLDRRGLKPNVFLWQLLQLARYATVHAPRGAVPGWDHIRPDLANLTSPDVDHGTWAAVAPDGLPVLLPLDDAPSTYDRIGGEAAVHELVEKFYLMVLSDPELIVYFTTGLPDPGDRHALAKLVAYVKAHMKTFLQVATGGDQTVFQGRSIRAAHTGLGITGSAFRRAVEHLMTCLAGLGLQPSDRTAVLARMAAYFPDVVERPDR